MRLLAIRVSLILIFTRTYLYSLTFSDFSKICYSNLDAPSDLEGCLGSLSAFDPEYFSSYTLMRQSQSLQDATPEEPRALVFGRTAQMVLTFNGNNEKAGGRSIEIMHWVPDAPQFATTTTHSEIGLHGRFEFRELLFTSGGKPTLSEANPVKCQRCHGNPLVPLWSHYPVWPGAYGGQDDLLPDVKTVTQWSDESVGSLKNFFLQQAYDFESFAKTRGTHPRYKFLGTNSSVPQYPYSATQNYDSTLRPNLRLGKALAKLNARQIMSIMTRQPTQLPKDKLLLGLVASLAECHRRYREPRLALLALGQTIADHNRAAGMDFNFLPWERYDSTTSMPIIQLILRSLGVGQQQWSLDPFSSSYQYFDGEKNISYYILDLLAEDLRARGYSLPEKPSDPQYSFRNYSDEFAAPNICRDLDGMISQTLDSRQKLAL